MDDLIRRADAIALASGGCHPANMAEELAKLPSAQPEVAKDTNVPINDCISRRAAICTIRTLYPGMPFIPRNRGEWMEQYKQYMEAERVLEQLPAAHRPVDEWCTDCSEYDTERKCCPRFNRVIRSALDDAQPRWIPCYEKIPTEAGAYLCTCKDERRTMVTAVKWLPRSESWNLTGARSYWKVVAWMPLPEAYKPTKEEET